MERKLELKDIAGYIPYGLNVISLKPSKGTIGELYVTYAGMNSIQIRSSDFEDKHGYILPLREIKPILRPLSDLYRTITHNGKEIVPIVELAKIFCNKHKWSLVESEYDESGNVESFGYAKEQFENDGYIHFYYHEDEFFQSFRVINSNHIKRLSVNKQYQLFDYLHELKIDFRNLIESGLAVSVYDIEINCYK